MQDSSIKVYKGLEGVYVAESDICLVDGQNGKLYYRGYSIEDLAERSSYEEVCYLLLHGRLPNKTELESFKDEMREDRDLPKGVLDIIKHLAGRAHPMDIMRTAVSALPAYDKEAYDNNEGANIRKSMRIISKAASIVAAIYRFEQGEDYIEPDYELSHAANFLYMLKGEKPTDEQSRLMDRELILHAEHSSNASTFSCLVTASTLADIYAAVTAGIATLKGPLHGGADEAALKLIIAIGRKENVSSYIQNMLKNKQKIMGFGHRVYKTYDPRAKIIKEDLLNIEKKANTRIKRLIEVVLEVERETINNLSGKGIYPNMDLFSGIVYQYLGVPSNLFTPIFAASRTVGWCAHIIEYMQSSKLIRPLELYKGKRDLKYIDIDSRA
ncbi:MAG: citrate synthase [Candidatus Micrarchaeota archaeon]|nr:MAG: citrate synthase [Candidatus Micrarchaeota archaeon]